MTRDSFEIRRVRVGVRQQILTARLTRLGTPSAADLIHLRSPTSSGQLLDPADRGRSSQNPRGDRHHSSQPRAGVRDFESADRFRAHDSESSIRVALRTDECAKIADARASRHVRVIMPSCASARSLSRLKLARCPHSLAPTLVTLPSMSLIPSARLQAAHTANIFPE
jgi:hypothetical protein